MFILVISVYTGHVAVRYINKFDHNTIEVIIMATISRDTPLMELTLRRYEKPDSLNKRELVRKLGY